MKKKSPSKRLWEKITKDNPIRYLIDPDELLKKYPKQRSYVDFVSSLVLEKEKNKAGKRRLFSKLTQREVLEYQQFKCKDCGKKSKVWDFDHIDGNRENNDASNCQALCPNCHAKKTRKKEKR